MKKRIISLMILCINPGYAQENKLSLFFSAGRATEDIVLCFDPGGIAEQKSGIPVQSLAWEQNINYTNLFMPMVLLHIHIITIKT